VVTSGVRAACRNDCRRNGVCDCRKRQEQEQGRERMEVGAELQYIRNIAVAGRDLPLVVGHSQSAAPVSAEGAWWLARQSATCGTLGRSESGCLTHMNMIQKDGVVAAVVGVCPEGERMVDRMMAYHSAKYVWNPGPGAWILANCGFRRYQNEAFARFHSRHNLHTLQVDGRHYLRIHGHLPSSCAHGPLVGCEHDILVRRLSCLDWYCIAVQGTSWHCKH